MSFRFNPFTGTFDYDSSSAGGGTGNRVVEYRTITNAEAVSKEITLSNVPSDPSEVVLDIISGVPQKFGTDYSVTGDVLTWNGLGLDVTLEENDDIRIIYTV